MTPQTATATTPRNAAADDPILAARIRAGEGVGSAMPAIRIEGLNKWYGEFHVLTNIDLTVAKR